MSCPRCQSADLDASGTCPACGFKESASTPENGAAPDEKSPANLSGLIEVDYSGPSDPAPTEKIELPQWRQDLARRLQEIRQKREAASHAGADQGLDKPALPEQIKRFPGAEAAKAEVVRTPSVVRPPRRTPRLPKPLPTPQAAGNENQTTAAAPVQNAVELPLFRSVASGAPAESPQDGSLKPSPDSNQREIRSLIDRMVIRQTGTQTSEEPAKQRERLAPSIPVPPEGRLILVSRTLSGLVDLLIVAICTGAFIIATDLMSGIDIFDGKSLAIFSLLLLAVFFLYSAFFLGTANQTIGMMLTDLKVIDAAQRRPRLGQILWRSFGYLVSVLMFGAGLLWGCFDRQSRCLHDRLSDTRVVRI